MLLERYAMTRLDKKYRAKTKPNSMIPQAVLSPGRTAYSNNISPANTAAASRPNSAITAKDFRAKPRKAQVPHQPIKEQDQKGSANAEKICGWNKKPAQEDQDDSKQDSPEESLLNHGRGKIFIE